MDKYILVKDNKHKKGSIFFRWKQNVKRYVCISGSASDICGPRFLSLRCDRRFLDHREDGPTAPLSVFRVQLRRDHVVVPSSTMPLFNVTLIKSLTFDLQLIHSYYIAQLILIAVGRAIHSIHNISFIILKVLLTLLVVILFLRFNSERGFYINELIFTPT